MKNVDDAYPLTPSQLGLLYDSQRYADPELYFEQVRFDVIGQVDLDDLRRSWRDTIQRHPALRTAWLWEGLEQPVQVVRTKVDLPWTILDWTLRPETSLEAELDKLAARDRAAGFDLTRAPALRVTVVRLPRDRMHVVWSFHHIMLDGWSAALVLSEVLDRLAGLGDVDAAPAVTPFRRYIEWLEAQDHEGAERFWREYLRGVPRATVLAGDQGASARPFEPGHRSVSLGPEATAELLDAARRHRVTVNTFVQTAWSLVLCNHSGDDDVVFGVTMSGRPSDLDGIERMVGMFLTTLPLRVCFERGQTVAEAWSTVQSLQLDLEQHRCAPLSDIVRWSDVTPGEPLFDSVLIFENFPRPTERSRGFAVEHHSVREQTQFPLTLMVGLTDRLEFSALFDESRFGGETIELLLERVVASLLDMSDDPSKALSELPVTSEALRHRTVVEWNATDRSIPDGTVHRAVDQVSVIAPDRLALSAEGVDISYGELRRRSDGIAAWLVAAGVGVGSTVGVVLERSPDAVVVLLGVMKSGAAYVALEPGTPRYRLRSIVEDADMSIVLSTGPMLEMLRDLGVEPTDVDALTNGDDLACELPDVAADAAMFVVFTSGSTGRPVGVPGSHRAVLNRCQWQFDTYPFLDDEVVCQKTTFNFVDHVAELWAPLIAGRPVMILPDEVVQSPDRLVRALARHRARRIILVPSLLAVLLEYVPELGRQLPELRLWVSSGEPLSSTLADQFLTAVAHATLLNVYGMSEAMADVTAHEHRGPGRGDVPIGRPIHNQRVYVLDRDLRPAPIGVRGQIFVSGPALADGYLHNPELTAERFSTNPFSADSISAENFSDGAHGRLYATGDAGRWNASGELEYDGRLDRQVKVRGVRVELVEVERALRDLDHVRDAAVTTHTSDGHVDLVAYVVPDEGFDPVAARRALRDRLPSQFIPGAIEPVEQLPRLVSGKLDRDALRPRRHPQLQERDVGPIDGETKAMIGLWEEIIGTRGIGPDDAFFDVGGHSMAAMRVLARLLREQDVNLGLATFHASPTPRALAAVVRRARVEGASEFRHVVPFSTSVEEHRGTMFCVHGIGGNPLGFAELARRLEPDWAVVGIQARGVDGVGPLPTSMDELCSAYLAEIVAFGGPEARVLAGYSSGGIFALELAHRLIKQGQRIDGVVLIDTFHPSVTQRSRRIGRHLTDLIRRRSAYVRERLAFHQRQREYATIDARVATAAHSDVMPFELRARWIAQGLRAILDGHEPATHEGPVWLFHATTVDQRFEHVGDDRGWRGSCPHLDVVAVTAGHDDILREPGVDRLASELRVRLDGARHRGSSVAVQPSS